MEELIKISEDQLITIKVLKNTTSVTATQGLNKTEFEITGITVIPQFAEVKPTEIRNRIIDKNQASISIKKIDELTNKGIYVVNIRDYSTDEIQYFSKLISEKWLNEIWKTLINDETKPFIASLKDEKVKEIIINENPELFKTEMDFENFCSKYNLSIKNFIVPAKFSELDIKLKEIESRLDLEQFFARRFLYCSTLIDKIQKRVSDYISNGNRIEPDNLKVLNGWIKRMENKLEFLKNFNNYYKLYDMPLKDKKIEIKDSKNVVIANDLSSSKVVQKTDKSSKSESKFNKRIGIWTLILMAIGIIVTIIINWDKIFK